MVGREVLAGDRWVGTWLGTASEAALIVPKDQGRLAFSPAALWGAGNIVGWMHVTFVRCGTGSRRSLVSTGVRLCELAIIWRVDRPRAPWMVSGDGNRREPLFRMHVLASSLSWPGGLQAKVCGGGGRCARHFCSM